MGGGKRLLHKLIPSGFRGNDARRREQHQGQRLVGLPSADKAIAYKPLTLDDDVGSGFKPFTSGDENAFIYKPLKADGIRLVSYEPRSGGDELIKLSLQHFTADTAPPYYACSYVWGDSTSKEPILVNGCRFGITKNLFSALTQFASSSHELTDALTTQLRLEEPKVFLWVDAVCLNQDDADEKSREVPRMGTIFSQAFTVLIWLGSVDSLRPYEKIFEGFHLTLECLRTLAEYINSNIHRIYIGCPHDEIPNVTEESLTICSGDRNILNSYSTILGSPWFVRIWTIQEYCLSQREPIAFVDNHLFSLRTLHHFGRALAVPESGDDDSDSTSGLRSLTRNVKNRMTFVLGDGDGYMPLIITTPSFSEKPFCDRLLWLLTNNRSKQASFRHDLIYGLFGLLDTASLPPQLMPDYTKSYALVCREYTIFFIDQTRSLDFLTVQPPEGQPTWVADFARYRNPSRIQPDVLHEGFFTNDGLGLVVEGHLMSRVVLIADRFKFHNFRGLHCGPSACDNHADCLSSDTKGYRSAGWQHRLRDAVGKATDFTIDTKLEAALNCADSPRKFFEALHKMNARLLSELHRLLDREDSFLLQDDGVMCNTNDVRWLYLYAASAFHTLEIWALKGARRPYMISRETDGSAKYVGHLWDHKLEMNETFFSTRKIERITLV